MNFHDRNETAASWKTHILKRLNDFFHVHELAIVRLERKLYIDTSDFVSRHFVFPLTFSVWTPRK